MLQKPNRLREERIINALFAKGASYRTPYFILRYTKKEQAEPRYTVIVSKKISKKAVERNKIKRRIREALRLQIASSPIIDCVILGSHKILDADFEELKIAIQKAFEYINHSR
jgi:ribonuclease P protein component